MTSRNSSPSYSPTSMKRRSCARKCERACCSVVRYLPLAFVYGLTTWAVWVIAGMGLGSDTRGIRNSTVAGLGILCYALLNWSYTTAVFTDPGSPSTIARDGYSHLPTHEPAVGATSFTVKSTGEIRYCKKCQARKPDRAHHCSTCGRCVLKMDHHCPWLATCVGLHNYKAFLLFLIYTTVLCWICFGATSTWLWTEVLNDVQYTESFMPINYILLCVISGIIGLVLTGFTGWHLSLAIKGQTTIECLERTRYLSPLRKSMRKQIFANNRNSPKGQTYGQQLTEMHANALPGVTRDEEGEAMLPSADVDREHDKHQSYSERERSRERERYEDYLDEQDSEKLPNAFDLGWKKNIAHLFGGQLLLRCLPICNTTGDGWRWEPSPKWIEAREAVRRQREQQWQRQEGAGYEDYQQNRDNQRWSTDEIAGRNYIPTSKELVNGSAHDERSRGRAEQKHNRARRYADEDDLSPSSRMSLKTLPRGGSFDGIGDEQDYYEVSSDGESLEP